MNQDSILRLSFFQTRTTCSSRRKHIRFQRKRTYLFLWTNQSDSLSERWENPSNYSVSHPAVTPIRTKPPKTLDSKPPESKPLGSKPLGPKPLGSKPAASRSSVSEPSSLWGTDLFSSPGQTFRWVKGLCKPFSQPASKPAGSKQSCFTAASRYQGPDTSPGKEYLQTFQPASQPAKPIEIYEN